MARKLLYRRIMHRRIRYLLIISLLVVLLAVILFKVSKSHEKSIEIEDKCGKFLNLMSHTIGNEEECTTRCRSQCLSIDMGYSRVGFAKNVEGCNKCTCYCA